MPPLRGVDSWYLHVWPARMHNRRALNIGANAAGSVPWDIVVLLTVLTLLPAIVLSMTPFVRLLVIFHFPRQALGNANHSQQSDIDRAVADSHFFFMQPVGAAIHAGAIVTYEQGKTDAMGALDLASGPMPQFMLKYSREKDLALFLEMAKQAKPMHREDLPMRVVVPAYLISELKAGLQIGAALYLPFLVVDMAVAAITT